MIEINYGDIVTDELMQGAILNDEFPGFKEDYAVLHCLLKIFAKELEKEWEKVTAKWGPEWGVFEIGTNKGTGTNIICNALPDFKVYSLDLPMHLAHDSLKERDTDQVGINCKFPYTQLRGDSMTFNYNKINAQIYFIDGEHDKEHPDHEIEQAMQRRASFIILHDADVPEVWEAIKGNQNSYYDLFRVIGTRIAYFKAKRDKDFIINGMNRNLLINAINEATGHPNSKQFMAINPDDEKDVKRANAIKAIYDLFEYKSKKK